MRKAPSEPFLLLFVTSVCTIIWGAITGTWFGVEVIARTWPFSMFVINEIASFPIGDINTTEVIIPMCFIIGLVHVSIARLKNFFGSLPKLKAIGELGWLCIAWAAFLLIKVIVLGDDFNGPIIPQLPEIYHMTGIMWLGIIGVGFIILFSEQDGNIIKGMLVGLGKLPLKALDAIGTFSDIISYVRLFAVGLATVEVAKSFNNMAAGVGFGFPMVIGAALILFFGHALNIAMGAMSLIVHGVRLNMLEFAGHLGMEWTGIPYMPFGSKDK